MVGSHLTDYLLDNTDWDVAGLARWRSPLDNIEHHLDRINRGDRIQLVYGDLRDYVSIQRAVRERLSDLLFVPFSFDRTGMQVIHYQPGTPQ